MKRHEVEPEKINQLLEFGNMCKDALLRIEKVLEEHKNLGKTSRSTVERLRWDQDRYQKLLDHLHHSISLLQTFYSGISNSAILRIERIIKQSVREHSNNRRASDAISELSRSGMADGDGVDNDVAWTRFTEILEERGITAETANQYRDEIIRFFQDAMNRQVLEETLRADLSSARSHQEHEDDTPQEATPIDDDNGKLDLRRAVTSESPSSDSDNHDYDLNAMVVDAWNSRQWRKAQLELKSHAKLSAEGTHKKRWYLHMLGIAYSMNGQFQIAKAVFSRRDYDATETDQEAAGDHSRRKRIMNGVSKTTGALKACVKLKPSGRANTSLKRLKSPRNSFTQVDCWDMIWLGDTCLQLGELQNALVAWAVAIYLLTNNLAGTQEGLLQQLLQEYSNLSCVALNGMSNHSEVLSSSDLFDDCTPNDVLDTLRHAYRHAQKDDAVPDPPSNKKAQVTPPTTAPQSTDAFRRPHFPILDKSCFDEKLFKHPLATPCKALLCDSLLCTPVIINSLFNDPDWRQIASVSASASNELSFVTKRKPDWIATTIMSALKHEYPDKSRASVSSNHYDSGRWRAHCYTFYKASDVGFAVRLSCEIVKVSLFGPYGVRVYQKPQRPLRSVSADFSRHDPLLSFNRLISSALIEADKTAKEWESKPSKNTRRRFVLKFWYKSK